jgi:hypothetical protein
MTAGGIRSSTQSSIRHVADASWLPLPHPLGHGTVATFLLKNGSVVLLDAAQQLEVRSSRRARSETLRQLIGASVDATSQHPSLLNIGKGDHFVDIDRRGRDRMAHRQGGGKPAVILADGPKCESTLCLAPARLALLQLILQVWRSCNFVRLDELRHDGYE